MRYRFSALRSLCGAFVHIVGIMPVLCLAANEPKTKESSCVLLLSPCRLEFVTLIAAH